MPQSPLNNVLGNHTNVLLPFAIVVFGFLAGLVLGRTIAGLVKSPALGGFISRVCIIIGTLASLPLAYHFATRAG